MCIGQFLVLEGPGGLGLGKKKGEKRADGALGTTGPLNPGVLRCPPASPESSAL
jgi:hypothetical protein